MSVLHYRSPVIEILPPFTFMVWEIAIPDCGYIILLWKNGHYLSVQFPAPTEPYEDVYDHLKAEVKQLQSHAKSLVFGKTNWVYFIRDRNGKRALAYRQRPKRRISYLPFAPVVHESELTYIRPVGAYHVEAIWRGQQVDAHIGVNDMSHALIEMQMRAYELLRGLDLTFEILAHVVDSDGNITGLICEPAFGRPFQAADILALQDATRKTFDRGLSWDINADNVMLSHDNKIRILGYCEVRKLRNNEEREEQRLKLQRTLHEIYVNFKSGYYPYTSHRYARIRPGLVHATPPLERAFCIFTASRHYEEVNIHPLAEKNMPHSVQRLTYRGRNLSSALPLASTTEIEEVEGLDVMDNEEDKPILWLGHHGKKDRRSKSSSPYNLSLRKSRKLLLAPE